MSEHHFDDGSAACPVDGCPVTYGRVVELFDAWRDAGEDVYWSELSERQRRQWWRVAHIAAHQVGRAGDIPTEATR